MAYSNTAAPAASRYDAKPVLYFLLCFSVSLIGTAWADYSLMNQDMASITMFAQEMLRGKHLYVDLITSQPPLIMYLTMPALGMHYLTGIPIPEAFLLYLFILFQGCILLSWRIMQRNALCRTPQHAYFILLGLYCGVFLLPLMGEKFLNAFSQREHIFCTLALPYIALMLNRLQGKEGTRSELITAGILGALGFCIKPHFALIFMSSELFLMAVTRRFFTWIRTDALIIITLSFLYLLLIVFLTPEYIRLIPRLALNYQGYQNSSWEIISYFADATLIIPTIIAFRLRQSPYIRIMLYLLVLIIASDIIFIIPKLYYPYHYFPLLFFTLLLFLSGTLASTRIKRIFRIFPLFFFYILLHTNIIDVHYIAKRREEILDEATYLSRYKTIAALNTDNMRYFPMIVYAGAEWSLSPVYLEYLPQAYSQPRNFYKGQEAPYHSLEDMTENERFFHEIIIQDLQRLPDAIIIDESRFKPGFYLMEFDYLHYFMQDPRFRDIWSHYELATRFHRKYSTSSTKPVDSDDAIYRRKD